MIVLLLLITAFLVLPYLYRPKFDPPVLTKPLSDYLAAAAESSRDSGHEATPVHAGPGPPDDHVKAASFVFDPNTIDAAGWKKLGVAERTIHTILNYRSRGGRFRSPADIRKIWGIRPADADRLEPYVQIAGMDKHGTVAQKAAPKRTVPVIDINTADPQAWKELPGVNEALANRIVKYREKLGGFGSVEQVAKTWGVGDTLLANMAAYLRFDPGSLPKLNLNTASLYELRSRFGLSYSVARSIIAYREQNGPYHAVDDVLKAVSMPDSLWKQLLLRGSCQ